MDREEILLKEYETCQSHNNAMGNQSWISISIITTINIALLGQIMLNIFLKSFSEISTFSYVFAYVFVIILGIAMFLILLLFKRWDNRVAFHINLNHKRMREIEEEIASVKSNWLLQKNWRIRSLDIVYGKKKGKEEEEEKIPEGFLTILENLKRSFPVHKKDPKEKLFQRKYSAPVTKSRFLNFNFVFIVLTALWGATALYAIVVIIMKLVDC